MQLTTTKPTTTKAYFLYKNCVCYICNVVYLSHISHFAYSAVQKKNKKKTELKYLFICEFLSDGMSVNPFTFMLLLLRLCTFMKSNKQKHTPNVHFSCASVWYKCLAVKWNINAHIISGLDSLNSRVWQ